MNFGKKLFVERVLNISEFKHSEIKFKTTTCTIILLRSHDAKLMQTAM